MRASVAVEDADHSGRLCLPDERAGIVLRLTRMDDNGTFYLRGESQLGRERGALCLPWRVVVVVVEAALSDRDRGGQQLTQSRKVAPLVETRRVVGMDSRRSEDEAGIPCRVLRRESRRGQRLSDADYGRRARFPGAGDYRVAVAVERRVCEVGMAVDED
jgi:hypothetical protein